jgi:hypothetical protein
MRAAWPDTCAARHLRAAPGARGPQRRLPDRQAPAGADRAGLRRLVDGSGKILIHGKIFAASQTQRASKLVLTLGNTSMQMKVNGRQVTVPPSATSIGFLLVPTEYRPLPVSKQPRCA